MLEPVALDSELSRQIIAMLEGPQVEISNWHRRLDELESEHGPEVYRHLFYVASHLDLRPTEAKIHWQRAHQAWIDLAERSKSPIDVRLAILAYFLQRENKLRNPIVVEIALLQKVEEFAVRDELTQLYNFRYFRERIAQEIERAGRGGTALSLLMADVDGFKSFNDDFGHLKGNDALRAIAAVLAGSVRSLDVVSRYGGEEFALLLPSTLRDGALTVAEKIRAAIERSMGNSLNGRPLTISVGVASYPKDALSAGALVARADSALYEAKSSGKNCVRCCSTDRRESPRFGLRVPGRLRVLGNHRLPLQTLDLSRGGMSFEVDERLTPGDVVQVELSHPEAPFHLEYACRVLRVSRSGSRYRAGAEILHIGGSHAHRLRQLLERLELATPDDALESEPRRS